MAKGYERNPALEARALELLGPGIERVYEEHMTGGSRRGLDVAESHTKGTLAPLTIISYAAGLTEKDEPVDFITPELQDAVYGSFKDHADGLEAQGLDPRPAIQLAGLMNRGTECNLYWYFLRQHEALRDSPQAQRLLVRWTTEEADHGPTIDLWGGLAHAIPASKAHSEQVALLEGGIDVDTTSMLSINPFVDPQEFDTVDAHDNYGSVLDSIGRKVMKFIGAHEVRHGTAFRQIGKEEYEIDDQEVTDYALTVEASVHRNFAMPASGSYPDFVDRATQIAVHGLFTTEGVLRRQAERVAALNLLTLPVKSDAAKMAQENIAKYIDPDYRPNAAKINYVQRARDEYRRREVAAGRIPFILGETVHFNNGKLLVTP